ncbi:MCP four helix bundle domain-containing protein, partial [Sphingobium sp. H39-3-25]|uniref:MCP four helix bundle domain-containing protein n=1 Tax=Sphingobium arseniciresistens TaxID=3030834 RepID=UPI0023B946B1|nr:MCP four helix bundle domain-containing protein [Sphingobium arseniciresistens]
MRATIKLKLGVTFALVIIMLLVVSVIAITRMSTLNTAITDLIQGPAARLENAQQLRTAFGDLARQERSMALTNDPVLVKTFDEKANQARNDFEQSLAKGESTATEKTREIWRTIKSNYDDFKPIDDKIRVLARADQNAESAVLSLGAGREANDRISKQVDNLVTLAQAEMNQVDQDTNELYYNARTLVLTVAVAALLFASAGAVWISLIVSSGLKSIGVAVSAVAIGDLEQDVKITSNDEIKDLVDTVNSMTANLRVSAGLADKIADGDLTVQHQPLSDKDTLGLALVRMIERLRGVVGDAGAAAENVSAGSQE